MKIIARNPTREELRDMVLENGQGALTDTGSISVQTKTNNRLAKETDVFWMPLRGTNKLKQAREELERIFKYMRQNPMIQMDRLIGDSEIYACRLFVSARYPHLALYWGGMLEKSYAQRPHFVTYCIPEGVPGCPRQHIYVFPESADNPFGFPLTVILGSDYTGELKMSFLRQFMHSAKRRNRGLALHAASKVINGKGILILGSSGTGKTSLTAHNHGLAFPDVVVRQDDIVLLTQDGRALGTEQNLYIKTEGLSTSNNSSLYKAMLSPHALLENDPALCSNARAVVRRQDIANTDDKIDLDRVDFIFFITRRFDVLPPVVKLPSPEWAALAFMLGESIETSAGDPAAAGQAKRVVGMNPFIIGRVNPEAEEGNMLLKILQANRHIQCFLLNTGGVGGTKNINLEDSALIMRQVVEGNVQWKKDTYWGYDVPAVIPGVDLDRFRLSRFYTKRKITSINSAVRLERQEWMKQFEKELAPEVTALLCNPA